MRLHEALSLLLGMGLGWFDDLGAEAVDKFITGLGHQLSIILLLGYVLLYVTAYSAEISYGFVSMYCPLHYYCI